MSICTRIPYPQRQVLVISRVLWFYEYLNIFDVLWYCNFIILLFIYISLLFGRNSNRNRKIKNCNYFFNKTVEWVLEFIRVLGYKKKCRVKKKLDRVPTWTWLKIFFKFKLDLTIISNSQSRYILSKKLNSVELNALPFITSVCALCYIVTNLVFWNTFWPGITLKFVGITF